jgi:subtilisin-like proprotein convertase family protein
MNPEKLTFRLVFFALIFSLTFSIVTPRNAQAAASEDGVAATFSNTSPITINTAAPLTAPTVATTYPSTINITGMTGTTTRVQVSLRGLTHTRISDLDFLLVGPGGQKLIFLSDAPNNAVFAAQDAIFTFADDAPINAPNGAAFPPGFYKPTNYGTGDTFPAPAPAAPYDSTSFAATFNGSSPNGTWSLFVVDDSLGDPGAIISGWELTVTTDGAPQTFANATYIGLEETNVRANPYPSIINVSGLNGVVTNLRVSLNGFSHAATQDVDILLVNPNGSSFVLMSDVGTGAVNNINLTFDDAAASGLGFNTITSGTFKPTDLPGLGADLFPPPAPIRPYFNAANGLSSFNNFSPNGNWQLYVIDDTANNAGTIAGGWSLEITTAPPVLPQSGCVIPSLIPSQFAVGTSPTNLSVGDFNNDNKQDLVVTNQFSNDVSILLNNGNGGFAPQIKLMSGGVNPYDVVVGSFNNDANQDLAVINSSSNNVSIFLGNGNGTFSAPTNFATGSNPISIDAGDFNNDGKQDLAIANFGGFFSGAVSLLFGNGNGGFGIPATLRTSTQPAFVKVANLNNDGNLDLVVANFGASAVTTYFGSGNGSFALSQSLSSSSSPVAVEIANVAGDSNPDLIVANYNGNTATIFTGTANGVFSSFGAIGNVGANPISVVAADLLGDGTNRIALALSGSNQVSVATSGPFSSFQQYVVGSSPNAIVKADFNGDGKVDLATANFSSDSVTILTNSCIAAKGNIFDFTGDRRTDVGIFRPTPGLWSILGLSPQPFYFGRDRDVIVPSDYDGDLKTEFAVYRPESGLWLVLKTQFSDVLGASYYFQFGEATDIPAPADFDGDAKADLVVFRPSSGFWFIRRSSDNSLQSVQFGVNGDKPVPADYDGDGKADLAVFRPSNGTWYIQGSTSGFFGIQFGQNGDRTVQGDYDGDGKADVAVFRNGNWYVNRSSDGGFVPQAFGALGDIPVPGDYEGDGKTDFAVFRPSTGNWFIMRSSDGGFQSFNYGSAGDVPIPSAYSR